ncbi:MAG TPA: DUF998 domain-containing protein [Candidatus Saccharimonadales bacterium]|jgi:hypothetical protein
MRFRKHERAVFAGAATVTILSAIIYCSWPLGFWLNPQAMQSGLASELGALGQPYNWVFIWGDIVSGVLLVAAVALLLKLYRLTGWARLALVFLAIYGICGALDAALPMHCLPSEQTCGSIFSDPMLILHGAFDLIGSIALIGTLVAVTVHVYRQNRQWLPWIYVIGIGGTLFAIASGIFYIWGGPGYWAQRYYITLSCIWVASMPFILRPKRAVPARPKR